MGERGVGSLVRKCVWFTIQTWVGEHSYKAQEGAQWMSRAVCWQFVSLGDATGVWGLMCTVHAGVLGGCYMRVEG
jgi:hypothetical protein